LGRGKKTFPQKGFSPAPTPSTSFIDLYREQRLPGCGTFFSFSSSAKVFSAIKQKKSKKSTIMGLNNQQIWRILSVVYQNVIQTPDPGKISGAEF
jgi:hypothetical protein